MIAHIAHREFEVTDGKHCYGHGEVRYTFTITPGRKQIDWTNSTGGYSPAEDATVDVSKIEFRLHPKHEWSPVTGLLLDLLGDVPNKWFSEQARETAQ